MSLYSEADYTSALVEFKRAYTIVPNPQALYNIGQTYYQLQSYAAALTAFEKYIHDAGPEATHRAEVESTLQVLRSRVGRLQVTSVPGDAQIAVDDEAVGKTPLSEPLVVSIGRRRVTATLPGRPPISETVEVAAGDTVPVTLTFPQPKTAESARSSSETRASGGGTGKGSSRIGPTVAWIGAGAFGVATAVVGGLALASNHALKDDRASRTESSTYHDDQSKTRTLALVTDIAGAVTIVTAGVALYLTLSGPKTPKDAQVQVGVGPGAVTLRGAF